MINPIRKMLLICFFVCVTLFSLHSVNPSEIDSLFNYNYQQENQKGTQLYSTGQYKGAIDAYMSFWIHNKDDFNSLYNIACCYGLLNQAELSGKFLLQSVKLGWSDYDHIKNDQDFNLVKENPEFDKYWQEVKKQLEQQEKGHGEISYIKVESKIRYRTVLPKNFDPKKEYILLIGMHGFGGNHYRFSEYSRLIENEEIIYVTPQAPYPMEFTMGKTSSFSWTISDMEEKPSLNHSGVLAMDYIVALTKTLKSKYNIKACYLSGFSQGAYMTYVTGLKNPKLYDGLICFGGGMIKDWITKSDIKKAKSLPVLIVHGSLDSTVKYSEATDAYEILQKNQYKVQLQTFEGGHNIPSAEFLKAIDWLKKVKQ